jgi:hypothetical protein
MRLGNRGQMGPIGEDLVYFTIGIIAVVTVILISTKIFADNQSQSVKVSGYREAQIYADKAALTLAWTYKDSDSKRSRVLDEEKIKTFGGSGCGDICADCCVCVTDSVRPLDPSTKDGSKCCGNVCGKLDDPKAAADSVNVVAATVSLPVSIRRSDVEFNQGLIKASVMR